MRIFLVILIIFGFSGSLEFQKFMSNQKFLNDFSLVISEVMDSFFCDKSPIDLTVLSVNNREINDILDDVLPVISSCSPFRLTSSIKEKDRKKVNNIAIMKNFNEFVELTSKMTSETFDYRGYYIIIFLDEHTELDMVYKIAWNNSISNINVIKMTAGKWSISTFFPFSDSICGNTKPVIINTKNLFPDKIKNLYKCPLKFPKLNYFPGLIIEEKGNETIVEGIDGDIMMKGLKQDFNFSIQILKMKNEEERWGENL